MRPTVAVPAALLALLLLSAPLAAAGPEPALYFMKRVDPTNLDDPLATTMSQEKPTEDAPMVHPVVLGTADLPTVSWGTTPNDSTPDRLFGPGFVGLWHAPFAANDGNLTAMLYEEDDSGAITEIARTGVHINTTFGEDDLPEDPTVLLPPDPSDPQAAAFYVLAQAMPILLEPPVVLNLGHIDHEVTDGSTISIGFFLEEDEEGNVPAGAVPVEYDATLAPTFLYLPWYETPEEQPTPQPEPAAPEPEPAPPASGNGGDEPQNSEPEEESPGVGLMAALALLGVVVVALRRRA